MRIWTYLLVGLSWLVSVLIQDSILLAERPIRTDSNNRLVYATNEAGDKVPDFSTCGYCSSDVPLPEVTVRVFLRPEEGDQTQRIQAAIDQVSRLEIDSDGFRGAVRLGPGKFNIAGQLRIHTSGVVLSGSGATNQGTILQATGTDRRPLVWVVGQGESELDSANSTVIRDEYVPTGATSFRINSPESFLVGERVLVTRPSTEAWIESLSMRSEGIGWKPGTRDLVWDREITAIDGQQITLDAPLTVGLDARFGEATVVKYKWPARLQRVGVQDLMVISQPTTSRPKDEDHAWYGLYIDKTCDSWIRRIEFVHFCGGVVQLGRHTRGITVEDCIASEPVSELGGYRRHTFFTLGQQCLFHRCWSEDGLHDFSTGHCSAGPNAFVNCRALRAHGESGPLESWSAGVLYDGVRIDGSNLALVNRWRSPPGTGWSAVNCMLWQCRAAKVRCFAPPGGTNWAIGSWATPEGDGHIESQSDIVSPFSLFEAQLRERIGESASQRFRSTLGRPMAATRPSYPQAAEFVRQSRAPARTLRGEIEAQLDSAAARLIAAVDELAIQETLQLDVSQAESSSPQVGSKGEFAIQNGWLVHDGKVIVGKRYTPSWWRGVVRDTESRQFGHNITRFAPGRFGPGVTESVEEIVSDLGAHDFSSYWHHYGLWYDRRRDDHLMIRRSTGDVAPPFYEQPFARSGRGIAWDGLSRYELSSLNPWYWDRLHRFAELGKKDGLVLLNNHYFQHNLLEAGAHWVDCPWRPANNWSELELPEPPPFVGDKRLFMAEHFYDVERPRLRAQHREYIRQCLENSRGQANVLHMTSAEYTGPLEFTRFWVDTIREWEKETGAEAVCTLSTTKDVQDAILGDFERSPSVDVIDICYWTYQRSMVPYAPPGGVSLAPRQHMRNSRAEPSSFESIIAAVSEYRSKYPEKPVIYNADRFCRSPNKGWAVLMGGGSLADLQLPEVLRKQLVAMSPQPSISAQEGQWCLGDKQGNLLVYTANPGEPLRLVPPNLKVAAHANWLDPATGKITSREPLEWNQLNQLAAKSQALWIEVTPLD